jgi:asparagine synthase (glutamine-hydrolysing)
VREPGPGPPSIRVLGYCSLTPERAGAAVLSGGASEVLRASGEFVVVVERGTEVTVVTSRSGTVPYYYRRAGASFAHGPTVAEVLRGSGAPWAWNLEALGDYIALDHLIGSATLHPEVRRTEPGSVTSYAAGRLSLERPPLPSLEPGGDAFAESLAALREEVACWWRDGALLCMTGGFDSRLLLAILLSAGVRPELLAAGRDGSFDLAVSRAVARRFGLRIHATEVLLPTLLEHGAAVAARTDGLLPLTHWPGTLFASAAPGATLAFGFNGEFARSYYADRGVFSLVGPRTLGNPVHRLLWRRRFHHPFSRRERQQLHPELARQFTAEGAEARIGRLGTGTAGPGAGLDEVFLRHYGANKTGQDLAAAGAFAQARAPFFSPGWIDAVRRLPTLAKLGSRYHRRAIAGLLPDLMAFPEERRPAGRTAAGPGWRSWVDPAPGAPAISPFFDQSIYGSGALVEYAAARLHVLSDVLDEGLLRSLRRDGTRRRLLFQLAAPALWRHGLPAVGGGGGVMEPARGGAAVAGASAAVDGRLHTAAGGSATPAEP